MHDTAIFYLTHQWTESIAFRFARLRREMSSHADCFVLLHDDDGVVTRRWREHLATMDAGDSLCLFTLESLGEDLGVTLFGAFGVLGNTHLPLMAASQRGTWRYCWQVESDVEYRGAWADFFRPCDTSKADLLASHVHRHEDWPTWDWWPSLRAPGDTPLPMADIAKAFMPVFRVSRAAIDAVLRGHRDGWTGHFEAMMPTVLALGGMKLQDFRDVNSGYIGDSQNPSPIMMVQSTMRWRPEITVREFASRGTGPLLFHPVKQNWAFEAEGIRSWPEPPNRDVQGPSPP